MGSEMCIRDSLEKFGGDSLAEIHRNVEGYLEHVRSF